MSLKRLRGKQACPGRERPQSGKLHRLLQFEEVSQLAASWLDQKSLCRFAKTEKACRELANDPEVWRNRRLDLHSRALRNSADLQKALVAVIRRWELVRSMVFPQCNASAAVLKTLRLKLPGLRSIDLRWCTRAASLRLLKEMPQLEEVIVDALIPESPLPDLKRLEVVGSCAMSLHGEGLDDWKKLGELVPNLEVLIAPWPETTRDGSPDRPVAQEEHDLWERLHAPPLDCKTTDTCVRCLDQFQNLRELDLSGTYTLSNASLMSLANLPKLERLTLKNMGAGISAEGLQHLANGNAPLQLLDLSQCKDTGLRPWFGRTSLQQEHIETFCRRRPKTTVLFS